MAISKAQQAAVHKYVKANYDRLEVTVPKGKKSQIKIHAEDKGESVNAFIVRAVDETMNRDRQDDIDTARGSLQNWRDMNTPGSLVAEIQEAEHLLADTTWKNVFYNPQLYKTDEDKKSVAVALRECADCVHSLFYKLADRIEQGE